MRLPSFSVILVFVVLVIAGAGVLPLVSLQYKPTEKGKTLTVTYSWSGASARVIEAEVTSKLEGVISTLPGISEISSVTGRGSGTITATFKPGVNIDEARFEIASLLRRVAPKLPRGVTPQIRAGGTRGFNSPSQSTTILTYTINSDLPTLRIKQYADEHIINDLSKINGIKDIELSGVTPFETEIQYDPEHILNLGVTTFDIQSAIEKFSGKEVLVGSVDGTAIILRTEASGGNFESLPVKNVAGRIVRLSDFAKITYKEKLPTSYSRINGLNTVNISFTADKGINTLELIKEIKSRMNELSKRYPPNFTARIVYDQSKQINNEINKILRRTFLSLLVLLIFVYAVSRSLKYLAIITVTLLANILIAFIFYYIFKIEINIYSLAGITVSLGIIIDTSIIMISHYGYYKNRKVFIAILAALLTTIGALSVVFLLPEDSKNLLLEFSAVIMINLIVSMAIAMFFIPALIDTFPLKGVRAKMKRKSAKKVLVFNRYYAKYIGFSRNHRWIFIVILILGFGLPVHMLPNKYQKEENSFQKLYNKTLGSSTYQNKIKKYTDPLLGGSLRLFVKRQGGFPTRRDVERQILSINASLPDGCTVQQLNDIVVFMENFLTQFDEIEMFETRVSSYKNASISVTFKQKYEHTGFPAMLKNEVIAKASDFGGANWSVSGIDDNYFSNNVGLGSYKSNRISITGYNYDLLYRFCQDAAVSLLQNQRVSGPEIYGSVGWGSEIAMNEYFIDFDREKMAVMNITPQGAFSALTRKLAESYIGTSRVSEQEEIQIKLVSIGSNEFDVWNLRNEYLDINGKKVKFSDIGKIDMRRTGNTIYKKNQQYILTVAYDFIGPFELARRVTDREMKRLNEEVLPIGFKADNRDSSWGFGRTNYYWLLFVITAIIYLVCSVLFESLTQPLMIIILIPVSFIGLFLTFYLTKFSFDQGGLAALIMLSGISVNAGIYVINQYNLLRRRGEGIKNPIAFYIKAYNHKIIPILLTIISTILGLTPFLIDGRNEVFWFSFAVGTMGGLLFSIIGIVFILPVWGRKAVRKAKLVN